MTEGVKAAVADESHVRRLRKQVERLQKTTAELKREIEQLRADADRKRDDRTLRIPYIARQIIREFWTRDVHASLAKYQADAERRGTSFTATFEGPSPDDFTAAANLIASLDAETSLAVAGEPAGVNFKAGDNTVTLESKREARRKRRGWL